MIPKAIIEKVLDATHIEEVVGEFLSLQKRGVIYRALCPFHQEKTPSFTVKPKRSKLNSLGLPKGGKANNIQIEQENKNKPDAQKMQGRN